MTFSDVNNPTELVLVLTPGLTYGELRRFVNRVGNNGIRDDHQVVVPDLGGEETPKLVVRFQPSLWPQPVTPDW